MIRIGLRVVGTVQLVLGVAYLAAPGLLLHKMGHSAPAPDLYYPLGMLAARFLAYGAGFWIASKAPEDNLLWIRLMALIQAIDFSVGLLYTMNGTVPWALSAFPMFNATWIFLMCALWKPRAARRSPQAA
jgi:peptidoglycan/LPS O-acetylase OafA/YrhL